MGTALEQPVPTKIKADWPSRLSSAVQIPSWAAIEVEFQSFKVSERAREEELDRRRNEEREYCGPPITVWPVAHLPTWQLKRYKMSFLY